MRRALEGADVADGYTHTYEDLDYVRAANVAEIVELDSGDDNLGDGDGGQSHEPDLTSARSRGNVVRKRNAGDGKPRSKSRSRRTRSQAAKQAEADRNEIMVD